MTDKLDPELVGQAMLTCEQFCKKMDYNLVVDFGLRRAYARDPGTQQFTLWAWGETWVEAILGLISKLKIASDILEQQNKLP